MNTNAELIPITPAIRIVLSGGSTLDRHAYTCPCGTPAPRVTYLLTTVCCGSRNVFLR